jgi:hypothetical protein
MTGKGLVAFCSKPFFLFTIHMTISAKQQTNAPQTCQCDDRIDDTAEDRILAAKQPCYKVKLENTNQTPVKGADD